MHGSLCAWLNAAATGLNNRQHEMGRKGPRVAARPDIHACRFAVA